MHSRSAWWRRFRGLLAFMLLGAVGFAARPPNVILILADDLGETDLGVYGNRYIKTPHLDKFASEGARWTNAYSAAPVCSPTRAALLTGRSTARVRFTGHITSLHRHRYPEFGRIIPPDDNLSLPATERTLATELKARGYKTYHVGKWHLGLTEDSYPQKRGFDINVGGDNHGAPGSYFFPYADKSKRVPLEGGAPGEYLTDRLTDEAIRLMENSGDAPFFLYLSHYSVHEFLEAPKERIAEFRGRPNSNPLIDPVYGAVVENLDENVGRLMQAVHRLGLDQDTLVIFMSDNGAVRKYSDLGPYREDKGHLYEGGLRVPFMMRWPGRIAEGTVCRTPTISQDLFPTVLEAVGADRPGQRIDGRSLWPELKSPDMATPTDIFWYYPHYATKARMPGMAIRSGSMKLIAFYDPPRVELYDLVQDPGETRDLASQQPEVVRQLNQKLNRWLIQSDPELHTLNPRWDPQARGQEMKR